MEITVVGDELVVTERLKMCRSCKKPMMPWHKNIPWITYREIEKLVGRESYYDSGICGTCIKDGGFPRECAICGTEKEFPREFAYELTQYAKYPDADTQYDYICSACSLYRCHELVILMADADNIDKVIVGQTK